MIFPTSLESWSKFTSSVLPVLYIYEILFYLTLVQLKIFQFFQTHHELPDIKPWHLSVHLLKTLLSPSSHPQQVQVCVCTHTYTHMHTLTDVHSSLGEQKFRMGPSDPKADGKPAYFDSFVQLMRDLCLLNLVTAKCSIEDLCRKNKTCVQP